MENKGGTNISDLLAKEAIETTKISIESIETVVTNSPMETSSNLEEAEITTTKPVKLTEIENQKTVEVSTLDANIPEVAVAGAKEKDQQSGLVGKTTAVKLVTEEAIPKESIEKSAVNDEDTSNLLPETTTENLNIVESVDKNEILAVDSNVKCADKIEINPIESEPPPANKNNDAKLAQSGLSLLAQYDSDGSNAADDDANVADAEDNNEIHISDTDSVIEVPPTLSKDYRNKVYEIKSDSDDSDSSSSSSSSSDSAAPAKYLTKIRKQIDKCIDIADDDDSDENDEDMAAGGKKKKRQPPKVRGELLLDELPQIKDLHITVPEEECIELGRIHSIVEQLVLVSVLPNSVLLDLDTVLFLEKGQKVLGEVFDVLGQVADPLYCIRFNSNEQIKEKEITVGDVVYVAPKTEYTQFVILSSLTKIRGSDASWENDIEPPPRYLDYSDDEQERVARSQLRNKDRAGTVHAQDGGDEAAKRSRSDSMQSDSSTMSTSSLGATNAPQRGRGGGYNQRNAGTSRGAYRQPRHPGQYNDARNYNNNNNNNGNYNAGSWHSNYHHHPAQNYRFPPPQSPPYNNYGHQMYAAPPPMPPPHFNPHQMRPSRPPPPPMYVLNPYAVRPAVLPTPMMYSRESTDPPAPGST